MHTAGAARNEKGDAVIMLPEIRSYIEQNRDHFCQQWLDLVQIPGPSGAEGDRAAFVEARFRQLGLSNVHRDDLGNVFGTYPGHDTNFNLLVAPHMDTVFSRETPLSPRIDSGRVWAPGVRDNTAGVAGVLAAVEVIHNLGIVPAVNVIFAGTVQEEAGLKGMQYLLENTAEPIHCVLAVDGPLGNVLYGGPGVTWIDLEFSAPGGHAWADFGGVSAIHEMANFISELLQIPLPEAPKTTLNVGTFSGGTVANAIAQKASVRIDLRSESQSVIDSIQEQIEAAARQHAGRRGLGMDFGIVTTFPAGSLPGGAEHPFAKMAVDVLEQVGQPIDLVGLAATDANPANARGIPALAVGATRGGAVHSLDEYAEIEPFFDGIAQIVLLIDKTAAALAKWR